MSKEKLEARRHPSVIDPLKDIIADAIEVIIDTKLEEGVLKDLPVTGSLLKVYKALTGIKDQIFLRKLSRFFTELETISIENRTKFWAKYEEQEEEKQKLGEQLIIYIERHDTVDKSGLLARAFGAYINGKIEKVEFLDLAVLIDSLQVHHLEAITSVLILSGGSFYNEINIAPDGRQFIPGMEIQRLLEYKDQTEWVEDRYEKSSIKTTRKHRITPLAEHFLEYVIYELADRVSNDIKEFHGMINLANRERMDRLTEKLNQEYRNGS